MNETKRFPSSIDVARHAGVSQSAVSRAFAAGSSISEAMRTKVFAAASELGYQPSAIPRIMLTHRSYLVAVATGGMYNPFNSSILEHFARGLAEMGYQMILVHVDAGETLEKVMPKLVSYRVDAIFVARGVLDEKTAEALSGHRIPIIAFHTPGSNKWVSSVSTDNVTAGRIMGEHFVSRGARRCAFVGGPHRATTERLQGFGKALVAGGLPPPITADCHFSYEAGRDAAINLLQQDAVDAVFCANDLAAIGFMDVARALGKRIPQDLMVAGFDDIPEAGWDGNNLTTFGQAKPSMVDASLNLLSSIEDSSAILPAQLLVPVQLIERGSTRRGGPTVMGMTDSRPIPP